MVRYSIIKDDDEIHVFGYDQFFYDDDVKDMWEKHKILYIKGCVMAVWIEERKGINPLVHLMGEDDGHLFWDKNRDVSFTTHWLDDYIKTLTMVKDKIKKN